MGTTRVARHYDGAEGARYFSYVSQSDAIRGRLEVWKFERHVGPSDTLVDFGCGAGFLLRALRAGEKVGIEVNPAARDAAARSGVGTVASAADLPDAFADVVISNHALEHTVRPLDELEQLRRIIKPGGRLVVWVPFDDWRMFRSFRPQDPDQNHHLYTWSPMLLRNLLDEAGYVVLEARLVRFGGPPFTLVLARFPWWLFRAAAFAHSYVRQSRQVVAVATPKA